MDFASIEVKNTKYQTKYDVPVDAFDPKKQIQPVDGCYNETPIKNMLGNLKIVYQELHFNL